MNRTLLRLVISIIVYNRKYKPMKKDLWGTILKVIIAVASALAGALGYATLS